MRIVVLALLAIALGAASPLGDADSDPVALITAIYQTYADIAPGEDGTPDVQDVYSKRLQALIDKDEKETPEGDVGRIDWDLFVDGQDWQLSELKIVPVSQEAVQAEVRATFKNFGEPRDILYTLVLENGHWRIDDIQETLKPRWTMSKILLDAPDAFPRRRGRRKIASAAGKKAAGVEAYAQSETAQGHRSLGRCCRQIASRRLDYRPRSRQLFSRTSTP